MGSRTRTLGILLLATGALLSLVTLALLAAQVSHGETSVPGAILGGLLALLVLGVPLGIGGTMLLARGRQEEQELEVVDRQRRVLDLVLAKGKVSFAEAGLVLGLQRSLVEEAVRALVGKGLFSGAVDWKEGVLLSKAAAALDTEKRCPNCDGAVEIAGKDLIRCAYCGADIFHAR